MCQPPGVPDALTTYLQPVLALTGDRRTGHLLGAVVTGILGSGSLVCSRIAAFSPSAGHVAACRAADSAHAER